MARFQIVSSRPQREKRFDSNPEFDIDLIDGRIEVGTRFVLWDTHHRCNFTIRAVHGDPPQQTLEVAQVIPWQDAWAGIVVDTNDDYVSRVYPRE